MALLPYEQTYAVDMTRGITAATPPASLNIASLIVADTGPVDRVTLTSQKDLVDTFCVGSAISATDNETIQFNGALLTQVATDVFRVDTSAMRFGLGSNGSRIYFDKEFNRLDKVTRAKLDKGDSTITSLYIELVKADGSDKYYMGDLPVGWTENYTKIEGNPDIDTFFQELYKLGAFLSITPTSAILNPKYTGVIWPEKIIGNGSVDKFGNVLDKYTANPDNTLTDYSLTINEFLIYPDNAKSITPLSGSQAIITNPSNPDEPIADAYPVPNFMVKALDAIYYNEELPNPWAESVVIELQKTVTKEATEEPNFDLITVSSKVEELVEKETTWEATETEGVWTGTTKITVNTGLTFVDGEDWKNESITIYVDGGESDSTYTIGSILTGKYNIKKTLQGALVTIAELEYAKDDTTFSYKITDNTDTSPYFLYNSLSSTSVSVDDQSASGVSAFTVTANDETTYIRFNHASSSTNNEYLKEDKLFIIIDNYVFYAGTKPDPDSDFENVNEDDDYIDGGYGPWEFVVVSKANMSVYDFLKAVVSKIAEVFTVGTGKGGYFLIDGVHDFECSSNLAIKEELIIDQTKYEDEFAVVCRFTSNQPLFTVSYVANDDEYQTIELTYSFKGNESTFTMSFDGSAIDGYGKSLYYDNYNEGGSANPYIYIAKLDGTKKYTKWKTEDKFGDEVMNNVPTEADYAAAILKYLDVKEKQYDFVTDAGHMSVALAGACKQVADQRFCQYVPSFPPKKDTASLISYMEGINLNDFRCQYLVPSHKSTYNGQFLTTVPASLTYMFARVNAFNTTVAEFSPLFGTIKGAATAPNLIKNFTTTEAQKLADQNINVITRDVSGTYIRSNFTSQKENSYLSEDQNAYMTNVLCHICEEYNPLIIAELNTAELRGRVVTDLSNRIQQRMVVGKNPTIAGYYVKCDEELNTQEVIEARQLIYQVWVQYTPTVAYVLAYVFVKRLGSF